MRLPNPPPPPGSRLRDARDRFPPLLAFVGSELWKVALQCWVMLDFCVSRLEPAAAARYLDALDRYEPVLARHLVDYKDAMGGEVSTVVRTVYETFAIRKLGIRRGEWGVQDEDFGVRLAAIDDVRFPFFLERWRAVETERPGRP